MGQGFVPKRVVNQEQCRAAARIHPGVFANTEFCGSLTGGYWATVVTWALSNCRQLSAARPRSSLHSWSPAAGTVMLLGTLGQSLNCSVQHLHADQPVVKALVLLWTTIPAGLFVWPNLLCAAGTPWVAAAKIDVAEHILKWKWHLDKLTPLGSVLYLDIDTGVSSWKLGWICVMRHSLGKCSKRLLYLNVANKEWVFQSESN